LCHRLCGALSFVASVLYSRLHCNFLNL
jgi:hypothetical protein